MKSALTDSWLLISTWCGHSDPMQNFCVQNDISSLHTLAAPVMKTNGYLVRLSNNCICIKMPQEFKLFALSN